MKVASWLCCVVLTSGIAIWGVRINSAQPTQSKHALVKDERHRIELPKTDYFGSEIKSVPLVAFWGTLCSSCSMDDTAPDVKYLVTKADLLVLSDPPPSIGVSKEWAKKNGKLVIYDQNGQLLPRSLRGKANTLIQLDVNSNATVLGVK